MVKNPTGVTYTPKEFKKMVQCLRCGKACTKLDDGLCDSCKMVNAKPCKTCEILLRQGECRFYSYDIKEFHREEGKFTASKELVREFSCDKAYVKESDDYCVSCLNEDLESLRKDWCYICNAHFNNTVENYKANGNFCPFHADKIQHDDEVSNSESTGEGLRASISESEEVSGGLPEWLDSDDSLDSYEWTDDVPSENFEGQVKS